MGAWVFAARTAIEVAALEGTDWEKLMLRSTGVAEEAACMVYLAISKLQDVTFGGGGGSDGEGLRGEGGKWEWDETKGEGRWEKGENMSIKEGMC